MTEKPNPGGSPFNRKKYTPAFKTECVRQVAAGARQSDVARAQGISPALEQAVTTRFDKRATSYFVTYYLIAASTWL